jgi:hypothetical protein
VARRRGCSGCCGLPRTRATHLSSLGWASVRECHPTGRGQSRPRSRWSNFSLLLSCRHASGTRGKLISPCQAPRVGLEPTTLRLTAGWAAVG